MQTLALISLYAPVVIIVLAVLAIVFSFFWVFLPPPTRDIERNGRAAHSVVALAREATTLIANRP